MNFLHAASFDCQKASTNIEKTICGAPTGAEFLRGLDERLSDKYNTIKEALPENKKNSFIHSQRKWLRERNENCETHYDIRNCLKPMYRERIAFFETEYREILFTFPTKDELTKICSHISNDPKTFIKKHSFENNIFDINNDGNNEIVEVTSQGTMHVPYCAYTLTNGKKVESMPIGFEWKDYWTYGIAHLNINGRTFRLTSSDDYLEHLAYLSYINQSNEEYVLCDFKSSTTEILVPNTKVENASTICNAVQNKEITYSEFINSSKIEQPYSKKNSVAHMWSIGKQGKLDFNNDDKENNLLEIRYDSGAGRGCGTSYLDEITLDGKEFSQEKSRKALLNMQDVDIEAFHPRCSRRSYFFEYDNKVYYEEIGTDIHKVLKMEDNKIETICTGSSSVTNEVTSISTHN
ncbi:MAG: hypothetical protein BV456_11680 [Thermoplasmata archaeon M8B2D]|nr:MAG: hypothetical protein BV456_11680 [Thermoplasmata archaeon M8B2D]